MFNVNERTFVLKSFVIGFWVEKITFRCIYLSFWYLYKAISR